MSQYYFFILTIFGFFLYFVVTDSSAAAFVDLIAKLGRFHYEKTKWWIWNNPRMPWAKFLMWKRALRIAKDLEKELKR